HCHLGRQVAAWLKPRRGTRAHRGYQSLPSTSSPAGVTAAHQVVPDMPDERVRTLPSARTTCIPPVCAEDAREGSQLPGVGRIWKRELGPTGLPLLVPMAK